MSEKLSANNYTNSVPVKVFLCLLKKKTLSFFSLNISSPLLMIIRLIHFFIVITNTHYCSSLEGKKRTNGRSIQRPKYIHFQYTLTLLYQFFELLALARSFNDFFQLLFRFSYSFRSSLNASQSLTLNGESVTDFMCVNFFPQ